ncbi:MAG: YeeE/YedE thiosulfate transporter family protein [Burkholderiales bacterium]|nr:YeeE/YedE thiosulfate transporter family protein [Burkholderiales bacterium]
MAPGAGRARHGARRARLRRGVRAASRVGRAHLPAEHDAADPVERLLRRARRRARRPRAPRRGARRPPDPAKRRTAAPAASWLGREWGFAATGVLAGLVILAATAQGQYLGISGGFAALVAHAAALFGGSLASVPALDETTAWRAAMVLGLFPGAAASAALSGSFRNVPVTPLWAAAFRSGLAGRAVAVLVAGFLIMIGALVGGGCTTGAFMAGFPTLSVGSIAMGMTFFGVGMATAFALYWGRWGA